VRRVCLGSRGGNDAPWDVQGEHHAAWSVTRVRVRVGVGVGLT
jgi:hypothetical protein